MSVLDELGLKIYLLVAGFVGGLVSAYIRGLRKDREHWLVRLTDHLGSGLVGAACSGYIAPGAIRWWNLPTDVIEYQTLIGFVFGVSGLFIGHGIIRVAVGWSRNPNIPMIKPPGGE